MVNPRDEPLAADDERPPIRRRDERHSIRLTALAHCHGRFQTVRIVDFSLGGLQLQGGFGVGPGDDMVVELLSGHRLEAKAAWSLGSRVGVRLLQPLSPEHPALAVLMQAARRSAAAPR
jgi:PilZ domain